MSTTLQFTMKTDQDLIPAEMPAQRVIEMAIQAPLSAQKTSRQPLNLALVIDRSGSMAGEKLEYVKQAAIHVLDLLQAQDRAALVVFDDEINLLAPSQPVTEDNRQEIRRAIQSLRSGRSTNLFDGWLTGCQEAAAAAAEDMLTRTLLLTDGEANEGITNLEAIAKHAYQLAARGVSTSTFGVGHGFNEHLLEAMSNQGRGNFYYIAAPAQIPNLFQREFQELQSASVRDVSIILQLPPQVNIQLLGGWHSEYQAGTLRIDLGSMSAGRQQELYVKVLTPPSAQNEQLFFKAKVTARLESGEDVQAEAEIIFRYSSQAEAAAEPKRQDVLERFASVDIAHSAAEALKLERQGENARASQVVRQALMANAPHADPAEAARYEDMAQRMERGMNEADRKSSHYNTYNLKQRRPDSK
jgi:Ca-activated chloride channel homolog